MAAFECLDDDHLAAAFRARLGLASFVGIGALIVIGFLIGVWLHIKHPPDHLYPVAANAVGQKPCVADAVEAGWQDVDQEAVDGCCQTNANSSLPRQNSCPLFRAETAPLGESSSAV